MDTGMTLSEPGQAVGGMDYATLPGDRIRGVAKQDKVAILQPSGHSQEMVQ